jgi:hypothetical protein
VATVPPHVAVPHHAHRILRERASHARPTRTAASGVNLAAQPGSACPVSGSNPTTRPDSTPSDCGASHSARSAAASRAGVHTSPVVAYAVMMAKSDVSHGSARSTRKRVVK